MRGDNHNRPKVRQDGLIVERLPGETLIYDEASDTAHCLGDAAAIVFELCDGTRTRPALAALTAKRLGRTFEQDELDPVLDELHGQGLLVAEETGGGVSRRQALLAGGGVAAGALITTIVAPLPAAAQSPVPPTPAPCQQNSDCPQGQNCVMGDCCVPIGGNCTTNADCCPGNNVACFDNSCTQLVA